MKNYLIIFSLLMAHCAVQGMQPAFGRALFGLKQTTGIRSKVSLAALAQVHKTLPLSAINYSPLLGAASALNGKISFDLKQDDKLAKSFFNQLPNEPVRYTVAPSNASRYVTPKILGNLLTLHESKDLYKKEFFESSTFKEWYEQWSKENPEVQDPKRFPELVRNLINRMKKESDPHKVREFLLAAIYFKGDTAHDAHAFLSALPLAYGPNTHDEENLMGKYAYTFIEIGALTNGLGFLIPEEIVQLSGYCGEKAVWGIVNFLLYNPDPETKNLISRFFLNQYKPPVLQVLKHSFRNTPTLIFQVFTKQLQKILLLL